MTDEISVFQFVTWVLIVVGWLIVNHQNNIRETRKEARSTADSAKDLTIEITKEAVAYLTSKEDLTGWELKSSLELLEVELERVPLFSLGSLLMVRFTDFADAITGGEFESIGRIAKEHNSQEVRLVRRTRNALLAEIERQFKVHYC